MAIRAYASDYVSGAQRILGDAVDFALMTLNVEPDAFGNALSVAGAARLFATGNPKYVAGMNGCEFARQILHETKTPFVDAEDIMYVDKGPEYWAGLAVDAEVPIRQIQLFEQRQRDINKTSADTLWRLSRALHCQMEELMERC